MNIVVKANPLSAPWSLIRSSGALAAVLCGALALSTGGCAQDDPARDPGASGGSGGIPPDAGTCTPSSACGGAGGTPAAGGRPATDAGSSGGRSSAGGSGGAAGAGAGGGGAAGEAGSGSAGAAGSGGTGGLPTGFVGNITTRGDVRPDFIDYWDQITPENEGKWGSCEPNRDQMNWTGMDRVRDYARQHDIPYKAHTLVWGAQQPGWIAGLPQSEQRAEVEEWIRLFCERYPDVSMIDVVNEPPPHTTPAYVEALGGAGASGYDWIVQAFRWARQYCPNATLILNDYNTIEYEGDNHRIIDITNRIKAAGAPIDAVGAQAHVAATLPTSRVEEFINRIATRTGLPVYITEYDIDLADDNRQREVMESQITMFRNNPHVKGITLWGYVSGSTWLPNTGLMSSSGQQRPALVWLMDYLDR